MNEQVIGKQISLKLLGSNSHNGWTNQETWNAYNWLSNDNSLLESFDCANDVEQFFMENFGDNHDDIDVKKINFEEIFINTLNGSHNDASQKDALLQKLDILEHDFYDLYPDAKSFSGDWNEYMHEMFCAKDNSDEWNECQSFIDRWEKLNDQIMALSKKYTDDERKKKFRIKTELLIKDGPFKRFVSESIDDGHHELTEDFYQFLKICAETFENNLRSR